MAAHPPDLLRIRPLESRMLGNLHVRFGGGRMEKELQGHLASRLPYRRAPDGEGRLGGLAAVTIVAIPRSVATVASLGAAASTTIMVPSSSSRHAAAVRGATIDVVPPR